MTNAKSPHSSTQAAMTPSVRVMDWRMHRPGVGASTSLMRERVSAAWERAAGGGGPNAQRVKILGKMRLHAGTVSAVAQESMTKSPEGEPAEGGGGRSSPNAETGGRRG